MNVIYFIFRKTKKRCAGTIKTSIVKESNWTLDFFFPTNQRISKFYLTQKLVKNVEVKSTKT